MDFLVETFEERVKKYRHDKYMFTCIDAGWEKLIEFYQKADRAPVYIAVIVLDPTKKWAYFQDWEPEWWTSAKKSLKTFLEQFYRSLTSLAQRVDPADMAINSSSNVFSLWIAKRQVKSSGDVDEIEYYVSEACLLEAGSLIPW